MDFILFFLLLLLISFKYTTITARQLLYIYTNLQTTLYTIIPIRRNINKKKNYWIILHKMRLVENLPSIGMGLFLQAFLGAFKLEC